MQKNFNFDVIIIGGSYAGLSAAMALGRALRNVLMIDHGRPCNRQTPHSHNFITQDGERPDQIAAKARQQVAQYPTVQFLDAKVVTVSGADNAFQVALENGEAYSARKLIFATGLKDLMPDIKGFEACWGKSILHCPYCHGYEVRQQRTGILANGDTAFELIKLISNWTKELVLFTNGASTLNAEQTRLTIKYGIPILEGSIEAIKHEEGYVRHIILADQSTHEISALYARPVMEQHCHLPISLGCELTEQGLLKVDMLQRTNTKGIFAAGDNSSPARSVSVAVAAGTMAGAAVNKELIDEQFL